MEDVAECNKNKKWENNREKGGSGGVGGKVRLSAVQVNERGQRIGESHPRAVLTDHEVGLVLELRAEGFSLAWIAAKMEVSKSCIRHIVDGRNRAQTPDVERRARGRR